MDAAIALLVREYVTFADAYILKLKTWSLKATLARIFGMSIDT